MRPEVNAERRRARGCLFAREGAIDRAVPLAGVYCRAAKELAHLTAHDDGETSTHASLAYLDAAMCELTVTMDCMSAKATDVR
jgi:hypothetical protein